MWNKIFDINIKVRLGEITASESADQILSLMGEKEIGVLSTSTTKDGVSHIVRDSHASGAKTTEEVRSNGSLEKRTDTEKICTGCYGTGINHGDESGTETCYSCGGVGHI